MPQCIFIISWDVYEGAIVTSKYPGDVEINSSNVQSIDVTHQFHMKESPWIVVEEKDFKAVSYYNEALQKAIALILFPNEVPNTFVKFLEQLAAFVLPVQNDDAIKKRLQESFALIQAEIPVTEIVLLNFANQIEQLKEEVMDIKNRVRGVMDKCGEPRTKLLLYLLLNDTCSLEKIKRDLHDDGTIEEILGQLVENGAVLFSEKEKRYSFNPKNEKIG